MTARSPSFFSVSRTGGTLVGDLDTDGDIDADDIDAASAITSPTRNEMILKVFKTLAGDADLNGTPNFDDFGLLAANYKQPDPKGWADGDWDGDGDADFDEWSKVTVRWPAWKTRSKNRLGLCFPGLLRA